MLSNNNFENVCDHHKCKSWRLILGWFSIAQFSNYRVPENIENCPWTDPLWMIIIEWVTCYYGKAHDQKKSKVNQSTERQSIEWTSVLQTTSMLNLSFFLFLSFSFLFHLLLGYRIPVVKASVNCNCAFGKLSKQYAKYRVISLARDQKPNNSTVGQIWCGEK